MSQQKRNPDIDFGFHATIPRMIRTEYETLTPMQKWLYVCLKDLCGEHGTCYRALRVLAIETHISTGMLSESIPMLHKAGLIHAEKKRRKEGGKEVWHITIVDIWAANGKLHPTKRSHSEQTTENVHTVNNNVHSVNDKGKERSPAEQECSLCETEEGSLSSIITEEGSGEEGTYGANAPTPARALFVHPEYDFLAFDDLQHPTLMVIYFVDDDRAEVTNKARGWTAQGVVETLASQGIHLKVRKEKEHHSSTVEAPTPAHLKEIVDEKIEEVETVKRRITGEHPAVRIENDNHYHIAAAAIGNEEGATHHDAHRSSRPADLPDRRTGGRTGDDRHRSVDRLIDDRLEQAPGAGMALPLAVVPPGNRHGDAAGVQAVSSLSASPEPAQAVTPPAAGSGSVRAPTARGSGVIPKRPLTSAPILTPEEQAVIDRWSVAMKKTYPLTDGLLKAARLLAPCMPSVEDLKAVRGFCFASNPDWFAKQRKGAVTLLDIAKNWEAWQSSLEQPQEKQALPKKEGTDFDIYKGNGPEEREAVYQEALRREAEGTLIE